MDNYLLAIVNQDKKRGQGLNFAP